MISKLKLVFRQFIYMYSDERLINDCEDLIASKNTDEMFYRKSLLRLSNKFSNPEISRIVNQAISNKWEDVFYSGFKKEFT